MKRYFFILFILLSVKYGISQTVKDSVKWMNFTEVISEFEKLQKPVFIYFYKNESDSCRMMEKEVFSNPEVANYINVLFYPVKINAETKDTIVFLDQKAYINNGKYGKLHGLYTSLAGVKDSIPTLVFFGRNGQGQAFHGFKNRDEIFRPLIYYAEDINKTTDYKTWYKYHKKAYPPGQKQIMTRLLVKWNDLNDLDSLMKVKPKKVLLNFYNYNKISCTLMRTQTYNNKFIADYLNKNYYLVNIDIYSKDTLEFLGVKYINENQAHKIHQLPIAALEGKMTFPSFIILNEEMKVLHKARQLYSPEEIEPILHYFREDKFKTTPYKEYQKQFKSSSVFD